MAACRGERGNGRGFRRAIALLSLDREWTTVERLVAVHTGVGLE